MALDTGLVLKQHQWYRVVSSLFAHAGIWHILMNMWCLWDIGQMVEPHLAEWKYAVCYFGAGLCGSFLVMLVDTLRHTTEVTVGASGAIFGLFGVLLVMAMKHVLSLNVKMLIINIVLMLLPGFFSTGISVAGHIGGLLGGFLLGLLVV